MESKILKYISGLVSSVAIILSLIVIFFTLSDHTPKNIITVKILESTQSVVFLKPVSFGLPVSIKIPTINVDAKIEYVGLTPKGAMDVPKGGDNVAWFKLGPRPGDVGSAVFSGHYGPWKGGQGSVFDNLNKLVKGDKIYIKDEKGVNITFIVRKTLIFDPKADASEVFLSSDNKAHLNLITCEGVWDNVRKTYSNRLVIFADKE